MKDNNNLLGYNVWSAGDYDNSLTNIQCNQDNQKIIISNDWSVNGENSFKITRGGGTSYNWCRLRYPDNTPGRTLTCTFKVYAPSATADIWLCDMSNGSTEGSHTSVRISPSSEIQEISLTYTGTLSSVQYYALRINLINDWELLYIDDIVMFSS